MADTDNTPEMPSTAQVDGVSVPSQITINIGGGSAAPDLSGLVKTSELDERLKRLATVERVTTLSATVADLAVQPRVIRLGTLDPVPAETPAGALIFRSDAILSPADREFPPLREWSLVNAAIEPDGIHLPGTGGALVPKREQMRPSAGKWEITLTYSWHGNFGEPETSINVYNCRTFEEFGESKLDQGAKLKGWTLKAGDKVTATLTVTPRSDEKATSLWAPWIEAPVNGFVVHDATVRMVA